MSAYRLTQRQEWILKFLAREGVASTNSLFVNTSPACLATGRRRALGTYGWRTPDRLQALGLIECHIRCWGEGRGRQIRYTWSLTPAGRVVAAMIPPVNVLGFFKGDSYAVVFG